MMDAEKLRKAVAAAIPTSDLEWPGDDAVARAICRAVVNTLGITRKGVGDLGAWSGALSDGTWKDRPKRKACMKKAVDALFSILDASEHVKVGQVWASCDPRDHHRRWLRVIAVKDGKAQLQHVHGGRRTWITIARMVPNNRGYRLVKEVKNGV